jgi:hypothetical protein
MALLYQDQLLKTHKPPEYDLVKLPSHKEEYRFLTWMLK